MAFSVLKSKGVIKSVPYGEVCVCACVCGYVVWIPLMEKTMETESMRLHVVSVVFSALSHNKSTQPVLHCSTGSEK